MASLNGLKSLFKSTQITKVLMEKVKEYDQKTIQILQLTGEKFVNKARLDGNYKDRTGNLRSSIGYVILKDGQIVKSNFRGKSNGVKEGKKYASELSSEYSDGFVLIGVAGMNYAAAVEAKNFDVITGSEPNEAIIKKLFDEINT